MRDLQWAKVVARGLMLKKEEEERGGWPGEEGPPGGWMGGWAAGMGGRGCGKWCHSTAQLGNVQWFAENQNRIQSLHPKVSQIIMNPGPTPRVKHNEKLQSAYSHEQQRTQIMHNTK